MRALPSSLLVVILVATIGLGWLFDNIYQDYLVEDTSVETTDSVIEALGSHLATAIDGQNDPEAFVRHWPINDNYNLSLQAFNQLSMPKSLTKAIKQGEPILLESTTGVSFYYYLPQSDQVLVLKSALPLQQQQDAQKATQSSYWFTALFYFILLILFMLWAMPLVRRLIQLRQSTKRLGKGDLSARIDLGGISYIRDIEIEFNRMAQRIEVLVSDIKLLSSAVSHDLRTPLARIRFGIDTIAEEEDPKLQQQYLEKVGANVDDMTDLVETLLSYARLDQTLIELDKTQINVEKVVSNCIASQSVNLGKNPNTSKKQTDETTSITFDATEQGMFTLGDSRFLSMLVANLVQNAIRYGHGEVAISLTSEKVNSDKIKLDRVKSSDAKVLNAKAKKANTKQANTKQLVLCVEDNGDGIVADQVERLFKPFMRGDALASTPKNDKQGYGVGLAIVQRIADWHQATIDVDQSPRLGGARFIVRFPLSV